MKKFICRGSWRTLVWLWNIRAVIRIQKGPPVTLVKTRFGLGIISVDKNVISLSENAPVELNIGRMSIFLARIMVKVDESGNIEYQTVVL
jgi:hypothetical protein